MMTTRRAGVCVLGVCAAAGMWFGPTLSSGQSNPMFPPGREPKIPDPRAPEPKTPRTTGSGSAPVSAGQFTLVIEGSKQGRFKGEGTRENNRDVIVGVNYDVLLRQEVPKGGTARDPVLLTKVVGAASPQIYAAYEAGETLKSVTMELYQNAGGSSVEAVYWMKLSGARIVSIRQFVDSGVFYEQLGLTFESAEVEHRSTRK